MYEVLLERNAEKELRRLPSKVHDRVVEVIAALGTDPRPPGCRKLTGSKSDWRVRVGDYRVVYEITDSVASFEYTACAVAVMFIDRQKGRSSHPLAFYYPVQRKRHSLSVISASAEPPEGGTSNKELMA